MRQMVLNHASVHALDQSRETVTQWLADLSKGMGELIKDSVVAGQLRATRRLDEVPCLTDYSLQDAISGMVRTGYREEYLFLARLATKSPLLRDMRAEEKDGFLEYEGVSAQPETAELLVLCVVKNWVAVGFPSDARWDKDQLQVQFNKPLSNGEISDVSEVIDNLTRSRHATLISQRHSEKLARGSDPTTLWKNRRICFRHILFGPDVERNLKDHARLFDTIVGRLIDINNAAAEWKTQGGPAPTWRTKVTGENDLALKYREMRVFASCHGTRELFLWHARVGKRYRIHLRFDAKRRELEIGYIGPHLPLPP